MKKYNSFPDLARSFALLKISVELESVPPDTIIEFAIQLALREKKLGECLMLIQDNTDDKI